MFKTHFLHGCTLACMDCSDRCRWQKNALRGSEMSTLGKYLWGHKPEIDLSLFVCLSLSFLHQYISLWAFLNLHFYIFLLLQCQCLSVCQSPFLSVSLHLSICVLWSEGFPDFVRFRVHFWLGFDSFFMISCVSCPSLCLFVSFSLFLLFVSLCLFLSSPSLFVFHIFSSLVHFCIDNSYHIFRYPILL